MDRIYYQVTGAELKAKLDDFFAKNRAGHRARFALCEELGGKAWLDGEEKVTGVQFDSQPCKRTWRQHRRGESGCYEPRLSTPEGKAMAARLAIPKPGVQALTEMLTGSWLKFMNGPRILFLGCSIIGDSYVLSVPLTVTHEVEDRADTYPEEHPPKWQPPADQARRLKNSEYWAMKEAAQEAQPAAA